MAIKNTEASEVKVSVMNHSLTTGNASYKKSTLAKDLSIGINMNNTSENEKSPNLNEPAASLSFSDTPTGRNSVTSTTNAGRKYERRTKRFIWPDELHRLFVASVFDVGLKNASPKALLTLMGHPAVTAGLTTEHLKSHLQKYRLNYDRSRLEFLKLFDESVFEHSKQSNTKKKKSAEAMTSLFPICYKKRKLPGDGTANDDNEHENDNDNNSVDEKPSSSSNSLSSNNKNNLLALDSDSVAAAANSLSRQIDFQAKNLHLQFQEQIQEQLIEHALLQRQLQERLAQIHMQNANGNNALRSIFQATSNNPSHSDSSNKLKSRTNTGSGGPKLLVPASTNSAMSNSVKNAIASSSSSSNNTGKHGLTPPLPKQNPATLDSMSANNNVIVNNNANDSSSSISGANNPNNLPIMDPYWNLLANSLLSPKLSGMISNLSNSPNAAMTPFSLNANTNPPNMTATDNNANLEHLHTSQLQMHMAMQAQMNLHRQMMLRKVEVSQHSINNPNAVASNASIGSGPHSNIDLHASNHPNSINRSNFDNGNAVNQSNVNRAAIGAPDRNTATGTSNLNASGIPQGITSTINNSSGVNNSNTHYEWTDPSMQRAINARWGTTQNASNNDENITSTASSSASSIASSFVNLANGAGNGLMSDQINTNDSLMLGQQSAAGGIVGNNSMNESMVDVYAWDRLNLDVELNDDDLFGFLK